MSACVLDASFTFQWLFRDEASDEGYAALQIIEEKGAIVPALWVAEVGNVLAMAERRGRVSRADVNVCCSLLRALNIEVDRQVDLERLDECLELARRYRLTAYDATYLELASRRRLPLATKDRALAIAAAAAGLTIFTASV